jgi:hypothetical protein
MALPADRPQPKAKFADQIADWYDVYYTPEPANVPTAPDLNVLEQMFAYYDA